MKNPSETLLNLLKTTRVLSKPLITFDVAEFVIKHTEEEILNYCSEKLGFTLSQVKQLISNSEIYGCDNWVQSVMVIQEKYTTIDHRLLFHPNLPTALNMHDARITVDYLQYLSEEGIEYLLTKTNKFSRRWLNSNNLIILSAIYKYMLMTDLPVESLVYWDIRKTLKENLGAIGYSCKTLLRALMNQTIKVYGSTGFLSEIMNLSYMSNVIDAEKLITDLLIRKLGNRLIPLNNPASGVNILWDYLLVDFEIEGIEFEFDSPIVWIYQLYLSQYQQWIDDGTFVNIGSKKIYVHHHTVLETLARTLNKAPLPMGDKHSAIPISIKTHPTKAFAKTMKEIARETLTRVTEEFKGIKFPALPPSLEQLDKTKWRHLDTPFALYQEGKYMHHCIGGDGYIHRGTEDRVYFHYNDGSRHGFTIELKEDDLDDQYCWGGVYGDGEKEYGYTVEEFKGHYNDDPGEDVSRLAFEDLLACNEYSELSTDITENQHRLNFRLDMVRNHPFMASLATCYYNWIDAPVMYYVYLPEAVKLKELCDLRKARADRVLTDSITMGIDFVGEPGIQLRRPFRHTMDMLDEGYNASMPRYANLTPQHRQDVGNPNDAFLRTPADEAASERLLAFIDEASMRNDNIPQPWTGSHLDFDIAETYPTVGEIFGGVRGRMQRLDQNSMYGAMAGSSQQMLANKHFPDTGEIYKKLDEDYFGMGRSFAYPAISTKLMKFDPAGKCGFAVLHGRELAIARFMSVMVMSKQYSVITRHLDKVKSSFTLSDLFMAQLSLRVQYGFMSESEIIDTTLRVLERPTTLFNPVLGALLHSRTPLSQVKLSSGQAAPTPAPVLFTPEAHMVTIPSLNLSTSKTILNNDVDFNSIYVQEFLGFHNSLNFI